MTPRRLRVAFSLAGEKGVFVAKVAANLSIYSSISLALPATSHLSAPEVAVAALCERRLLTTHRFRTRCTAVTDRRYRGIRGDAHLLVKAFPGAIRDCQHSASRHGRRTPDLPRHVFLRGLASLDVWDGASLEGSPLSDIQRRSAKSGIASRNPRQASPRSDIKLRKPRQASPRSGIELRNSRQASPRSGTGLRNPRQASPRSGTRLLRLFDHPSHFTTPVR